MWVNIYIENQGKIKQEIYDYFYNYSLSLKLCQNKLEKKTLSKKKKYKFNIEMS